jgi:hypothetical protein
MNPREAFLAALDSWASCTFTDGLLAVPYIYGGKDPQVGLDCSGAITNALQIAGVAGFPPDLTNAQKLYEASAPTNIGDVQPGTLVFYGQSRDAIDHVMAVADQVAGVWRVLGASGAGKRCTTLALARQAGACVHYEPRINYRPDFLAVGEVLP